MKETSRRENRNFRLISFDDGKCDELFIKLPSPNGIFFSVKIYSIRFCEGAKWRRSTVRVNRMKWDAISLIELPPALRQYMPFLRSARSNPCAHAFSLDAACRTPIKRIRSGFNQLSVTRPHSHSIRWFAIYSFLHRRYEDKNSRGCFKNGIVLLPFSFFFVRSHFEMKISSIINNNK